MADARHYICGANGCRTRVRAESRRCHNHGGMLPMRIPPVVRCGATTGNGGRCYVRVARAGQLCLCHALIDAQRVTAEQAP